MKIIEKITLVLFSTIILIMAMVYCLMNFGWVEPEFIRALAENAINDPTISNVLLGINIIFILLAIRCIFFTSGDKKKEEYKNGILLENSDGKLLITKETIENLVNNIVKGFENAEDITTRIELDQLNNLKVYVNLSVRENTVIKELSTNIQTKIKESIKKTSDLEVKEVNIKVKNVEKVQEDIVQN